MKKWMLASVVGSGLGLAGVMMAAIEPEMAEAKSPSAPPDVTTNCQDVDRDGYGVGCAKGLDCNDHDRTLSPGQKERCNLRDDDCNGLVDDAAECPRPAYDAQPVEVAASALLMGSLPNEGADDEHPRHRVEISAFAIDRYEVTNERYAACVTAGFCKAPQLASSGKRAAYFGAAEFARYPVVFVSWDQANAFCQWDGGRLPTEAEWELAARGAAPSVRIFPWGDDAPDCTRVNMGGEASCVGDTDWVGRRDAGASPWGAMDMAGNVWEWTSDWYDANYYQKSPLRDPLGPKAGKLKTMRGGCWMSGRDSLRVSCRKAELPGTWAPNVGFRCARIKGR